jgi:hypothetical protein
MTDAKRQSRVASGDRRSEANSEILQQRAISIVSHER